MLSRVDLRHQADDDEDYEEEGFSFHEALLEMTLDDPSAHADSLRICLPFRSIRVGSRQKIVIWVAGMAAVSIICFTPSAFVALFTHIPVCPLSLQKLDYNGLDIFLLILYYFIGNPNFTKMPAVLFDVVCC
ncbi:hypothetical protein GH714_004910 [Hevea brasiliensis]|uniref:Uncharacterized protein n=1 Tax=Hevea brasiliensis TaxID=3981 RepID=A0A6A6LZB5_HEVBR|nr:hypothetical protein GH714_004910 [Hevea brasiliensis]